MKKLNKWLLFWVIFWPSFLLSVLLNYLRVHYRISDERPLIIGFAIYTAVCGFGLVSGIKLRKTIEEKANLSEKT